MKYRVTFGVPPGTNPQIAQLLIQGVELEAQGYRVIDERLMFFTMVAPLRDGPADLEVPIIEYAAGVWRSVAAVGAYTEATKPPPKETPGEDPGRRQARR